MATDYTFNFTDPLKTAFIVKPYTVNGYATPDSVPLPSFYSNGTVTAVSASTSLVFMGKGMPDYGDAIQNNFVYLLENFANVNPPIAPIEGQLWYKNITDVTAPTTRGLYIYSGTTWERIIFQTATGLTGDLDMGGFNIVNMADPVGPTDAATKQYVDTTVTTHTADQTLHLTSDQNTFLDGLNLPALTAAEVNFLAGTTSNVQTQINDKLSLSGGTMSGSLILAADPTLPLEAATKQYVDTFVGSGGAADGVVDSGSLDSLTGVLTLGRTIGAPVVVLGNFAPFSHTQADSTVNHDLSAPLSQSYLVGRGLETGQYPTMPVYNALANLDQAVYDMQRHVHRQLIVSTGTTTVTLNPSMSYEVNVNKLQVFVNGIKQYANERGSSKVTYYGPTIGLTTETGLTASTAYSFNLTVDGVGPTTVTITTPVGSYPFYSLVSDIGNALTTLAIPVAINIDQYLGYLKFAFTSDTAGTGSSVVLSYTVGSLFEVLGTIHTPDVTNPVNTSVATNYAYSEVGSANDFSNTVEFMVAPVAGAVIEALVWS